MLCRGCQGIFSSTDRRVGHHRSDYHAVDTDAELKSCVFCSWLRSDAARAALGSFPRYRWTVRPLPSHGEGRSSISHGLDCVVITFRPVETETGVRTSRSDLFLPAHKFSLFRKGKSPLQGSSWPRVFGSVIYSNVRRYHQGC
jgi:hypothetical protein